MKKNTITPGFLCGPYSGNLLTTGHHNICIGNGAGSDLTTESYMLCLKLEGFKEFRMKMTAEEYEAIMARITGMRLYPEVK